MNIRERQESKRGRVPMLNATEGSIKHGAAAHDALTSTRPRLRGICRDGKFRERRLLPGTPFSRFNNRVIKKIFKLKRSDSLLRIGHSKKPLD